MARGKTQEIKAGDAAGLIAQQRQVAAIARLVCFDNNAAFLSLGDLQRDALFALRDLNDKVGEILEASQAVQQQPK